MYMLTTLYKLLTIELPNKLKKIPKQPNTMPHSTSMINLTVENNVITVEKYAITVGKVCNYG